MASTASSVTTQKSPSHPRPESFLRDPFEPEINSPPRNHLEERVFKRRRIEEGQDKSLIHGLELQQHAAKLLESNDLSPLQEAIEEYTETKKETLITIFKSFALHYPNAFSFKLAIILKLHPPIRTRIQTVALLLEVLPEGVSSSMHSSILIQLKNPLLYSLKVESEEVVFPMLCEMIGILADRLHQFSLGSWEELLQYACDCISGDAESNNKKGLMLLTELSAKVFLNRDFWLNQGKFDLVFSNILKFIYSMDWELKTLAYNASMSLMLLSEGVRRTEICDILLPILLNIIDQHVEEDILEDRVRRLGDLVTLEDGYIFKGKHGELFWCMIRVAEVENVSQELMLVAVNVLKELDAKDGKVMVSVIRNLSHEEVRRVLAVAVNFLSCVDDDPLWYDVDNKDCDDTGMTDPFYHGVFLFDSLSLDGDEVVFVPTAIEMITMQYASHIDWRLRHAAMLAIGWIIERNFNGVFLKKNCTLFPFTIVVIRARVNHDQGFLNQDMMQYFDQVVRLVLKSLDDPDPRVLWATMHAIKSLTEYKELLMNGRYHKKLSAKLVPFIRCYSCARVQRYAVIAIRSLVENCGLDKISPFGEPIVASLHAFLNHEDPKLQEEAIDTLRLFAVLMPRTFRQNYYDTTVEALRVIVFNKYSLSRLLVFAKYLECMVYLVRKVGPDNFKEQEAIQVMESIILLEGKLSNTEHMTKYIILKTLDQICRCPRVSIDKFIDKIMPMLLGSAQLCLDLTVDKLKDDCDKRVVENTMVLGIVHLIATTVETFKDRFMLHVDDLMSNVVVLLGEDNPDRLIAFAISIFNVIFPLFPDKLPLYHERYNLASSFALRENYPCSKLYAIPAIGICAMFGGDRFKAFAGAGIFNLYVEMTKSLSISKPNEDGDATMLCDTAVAALGKICEFHADSIDPKVVSRWLSFLPLKHDSSEARYTHGLLSKLIQRSDKYLFGINNENLPKIISIVKEILSGPDRLGTEEAINLMIDFIDQHGGMEIEIMKVEDFLFSN
ncbi:hypothetical protein KIW84_053512 [Lathyrus oleraceus]|uniref:Uncharacterized protein n=1 Tax=Pisum sativum TaxID=3888 RepID=A0A9D5AGT5_PEA|nr:hypothetical protein KIW84_053512 [Pisum sativum]